MMSNKIFTFLPLCVWCAGCFYCCIAMISEVECLFHEMRWYFSSDKKKWKKKKRMKPKMLWNVFIPLSAIPFNLHFFQQHLNKISKTGSTCTNSNSNSLHPSFHRILYQRIITIELIYILYEWCPLSPPLSPLSIIICKCSRLLFSFDVISCVRTLLHFRIM